MYELFCTSRKENQATYQKVFRLTTLASVILFVEFTGQGSSGSRLLQKKSVKNNYFFDWTFTDSHTHCQKLSIILENNMYQKLKLLKKLQ